jgi:acyl-CoA thioester hydrolase
MNPNQSAANPLYTFEFTIPNTAVDQNGHVNNVMFVQWMQDAAVRHYESIGGTGVTQALGATWVVRSHTIEYLNPAYAGELIVVQTWVADLRRVRSNRRYKFLRKSDRVVLVQGKTEWVFIDSETGAPRAIPAEVSALFNLLPDKTGA